MGAPPNPVDGTKYAELLLGVPMVLEYDDSTGGFKLVIDVENTLEVTFTGVTLELGSAVDTELPAAALLADATANPTVPGVGAFGMAFDGINDDWSRIRIDTRDNLLVSLTSGSFPGQAAAFILATSIPQSEFRAGVVGAIGMARDGQASTYRVEDIDVPSVTVLASTIRGKQVRSFNYGYVPGSADFDLLIGPKETGLNVSMISGSFPGQDGATLLGDSVANPYAGLVGALGLGYDPIADDWNRIRVETTQHSVYVSLGSGTFPGQGATFGMNGTIPQNIRAGAVASLEFEFVVPNLLWERVNSYDDDDAVINLRGQRKLVFGHGYDPIADDWDRLIGPKETGLNVSIVSGSFPGQGGATLLDDAVANPHAGLIGALSMAYDAVGDNWERVRIDARRNLFVTLVSGSFPVGEILTVDTELPAAAALTSDDVANPTAPAVGAFLLGYDEIANAWDRLRVYNIGTDDNITAALVTPSLVVGSLNMGYDSTAAQWNRMRSTVLTADGISPSAVSPAKAIGAFGMAYNGSTWDRQTIDPQGRLYVSALVTGTVALSAVDIEIGAIEIKDGDSDRRAIVDEGRYLLTRSILASEYAEDSVHASGATGIFVVGVRQDGLASLVDTDGDYSPFQVDSLGRLKTASYVISGTVAIDPTLNTVDTELPDPVTLSDVLPNPTVTAVGAYMLSFDGTAGDWQRVEGGGLLASVSQSDAQPGLSTRAFGYAFDPVGNLFRRLRSDGVGHLIVTVTGTSIVDTELPAATAAADGFANPTAPSILSHLMGYNGATWDRLYMGISGSLAVDLISQLDAVNDEVTAYVTGTLSVDLITGSVIGIAGQTKIIQREVINISGTAASANAEGLLLLGVASERIKVLSLVIGGEVGFGATIKSGFSGSVIGLMEINALANGPMTVVPPPPTSDGHWLETEIGEDLVVQGDVAEWHAKGFMTYYTE